MKDVTFVGIDASLETSLFEYGIIMDENTHEDGSDTHFVVYKIKYDTFGTCHMSEADINNYGDGSMGDAEAINDFLQFVGLSEAEWKAHSLIHKLHDLYAYCGHEALFGTDYGPVDGNYVKENYLRNLDIEYAGIKRRIVDNTTPLLALVSVSEHDYTHQSTIGEIINKLDDVIFELTKLKDNLKANY